MRYRVFLYSLPSPAWTFYSGHVDVTADNPEQARDRALDQLKRGTFSDRPRNGWKIVRVEPL